MCVVVEPMEGERFGINRASTHVTIRTVTAEGVDLTFMPRAASPR